MYQNIKLLGKKIKWGRREREGKRVERKVTREGEEKARGKRREEESEVKEKGTGKGKLRVVKEIKLVTILNTHGLYQKKCCLPKLTLSVF